MHARTALAASLLSCLLVLGCSKSDSSGGAAPAGAAATDAPKAGPASDPKKKAECEKACDAKKEARERLQCKASCG